MMRWPFASLLCVTVFLLRRTDAFIPRTSSLEWQQVSRTASFVTKPAQSYCGDSSALNMCICIDCSRVTNCAAYHFVETKHEQPHMTEKPTFTPREGSPTIHVNVRTNRDPATILTDDDVEDGATVEAATPVTTVEYDVVACADFVEDKGCWVRNMPEEIRKANPHFVPT